MDAEELDAHRDRTRAMWALGDYPQIAERLLPSAIALVESLERDLGPLDGVELLDVATGTGNVVVEAARRGARVTGCDLSGHMLARARERAEAEGLAVTLVEADAEDLPWPPGSFDATTSTFGVMFAPRPPVAVEELRRVLRPGGRLALTTWDADGLMGQSTMRMGRGARLPPGVADPMSWGVEATVRERLASRFEAVEVRRLCVPWSFDSARAYREFLEEHSPPHVALRRSLGEAADEAFDDLESWIAERASADGRLDLEASYLLTTAKAAG